MPLELAIVLPIGTVPLVVLRVNDRALLRTVLRALQAHAGERDLARRQQGRLASELLAQLEAAEPVM